MKNRPRRKGVAFIIPSPTAVWQTRSFLFFFFFAPGARKRASAGRVPISEAPFARSAGGAGFAREAASRDRIYASKYGPPPAQRARRPEWLGISPRPRRKSPLLLFGPLRRRRARLFSRARYFLAAIAVRPASERISGVWHKPCFYENRKLATVNNNLYGRGRENQF
jgi:hypothetical protein